MPVSVAENLLQTPVKQMCRAMGGAMSGLESQD
jgi:hypothetical protein